MLNQKNKTSNERNRKTVKQSHGAPEKKPAAPPTSLANKQNQEQRQKTILLNQNHFRMKAIKLFTFALAALALGACSKDDDVTNQGEGEGQKGELIEGISINFAAIADGPKSRAMSGEQASVGTEALIYEAFIFAKEAEPKHPSGLTGDWTVIRVTADPTTGDLIAETGGVHTEKYAKDALKIAVNAGATVDEKWVAKNVATFSGVRQGDYVYVIANDPDMTLATAKTMCQVGPDSEKAIQEYTANINKDYLAGLNYFPNTNNALPTGKFIMAGKAIIPVSPTIPSGGKLDVTVSLDRELAKVIFDASITPNKSDLAYGNVEFQEGDGIVVARIARKTSMFTDRKGTDWFVPANSNVENWPINNHALVNNAYSSFCDATKEGSKLFNGISATPLAEKWNGQDILANWNAITPGADVTEYRYSWSMDADNLSGTKKDNIYKDGTLMVAPAFYTTPNYSNNSNSVTVICTQATYVGRGDFENPAMIDKYVTAALAAPKDIATGIGALTLPNPLVYKATANNTLAETDVTALVKAYVNSFGINVKFKTDQELAAAIDALTNAADKAVLKNIIDMESLVPMMDRFYVAVLLQDRLANQGKELEGTMSATITTAGDFGNGIPATVKDAQCYNEKSDSLLMGKLKVDAAAKTFDHTKGFYISKTEAQDLLTARVAEILFKIAAATDTSRAGSLYRADYFAKATSYAHIKGQKVYYRADVADYVGGASNKMTERNTYYRTKGTINSLGANSIHDAIYSANNTMTVSVDVKNWTLSINQVGM